MLLFCGVNIPSRCCRLDERDRPRPAAHRTASRRRARSPPGPTSPTSRACSGRARDRGRLRAAAGYLFFRLLETASSRRSAVLDAF
jgi:hypothetical protein